MQPMASDSMSPMMEAYEFPDGKYAWNRGCCQCVICNQEGRRQLKHPPANGTNATAADICRASPSKVCRRSIVTAVTAALPRA